MTCKLWLIFLYSRSTYRPWPTLWHSLCKGESKKMTLTNSFYMRARKQISLIWACIVERLQSKDCTIQSSLTGANSIKKNGNEMKCNSPLMAVFLAPVSIFTRQDHTIFEHLLQERDVVVNKKALLTSRVYFHQLLQHILELLLKIFRFQSETISMWII